MTTMRSHDAIRDFQFTKDSLKDKIILVTGAGDGIGKVAALTYAKCGATVLLLGKTQSKLEVVYDEIEALGLALPAILPMDLERADFAQMQKLAGLIEKEFGHLDGVLHNAAILGTLTPLEMYDPITFEQGMRVNMTAVFMLTQRLIPLLRAAKAARWYLQAAAWVQDQERFGVLMHSQNKRLKAWQPFSPKKPKT